MKANITVNIDAEVAHEAEVRAARRGKSLSRLVGEKLEELVRQDNAYESSMKNAIVDMDNAPALGFQKPVVSKSQAIPTALFSLNSGSPCSAQAQAVIINGVVTNNRPPSVESAVIYYAYSVDYLGN